MLGGLVMLGVAVLILWACAFKVLLQSPACPTCCIPLQSLGETMKDLGTCGVETVIHYECSDCDRPIQRRYILAHLG
jgi:hypothetical protein